MSANPPLRATLDVYDTSPHDTTTASRHPPRTSHTCCLQPMTRPRLSLPTYLPAYLPCPQGDQWEHTALADSVQLFQETFLGPCLAAGRAELASKARAVATAPDFSF